MNTNSEQNKCLVTPDDEAILKLPAIQRFLEAMADLDAAQSLVQETQERIQDILRTISYQMNSTDDLCRRVIGWLYWFYPELPVKWIAEALELRSVNNVSQLAGSIDGLLKCERCDAGLPITSRTALQLYMSKDKRRRFCADHICPACQAQIQKERSAYWREQDARRAARLQELKVMPYSEYLQTPEWQEIRKRHLKRAGYRCQVCNTNKKSLHVHHRTYDRRGEEDFKDLIVLCSDCHRLFHEQGKLADYE